MFCFISFCFILFISVSFNKFRKNRSKLRTAVSHLCENQFPACFSLIPVLPADSFCHHRAHKKFCLRKTDLIIEKRPGCMICLTAQNCFLHHKFLCIRHFPRKQGIFISKCRLIFLPNSLLRHSLLHQSRFQILPLRCIFLVFFEMSGELRIFPGRQNYRRQPCSPQFRCPHCQCTFLRSRHKDNIRFFRYVLPENKFRVDVKYISFHWFLFSPCFFYL